MSERGTEAGPEPSLHNVCQSKENVYVIFIKYCLQKMTLKSIFFGGGWNVLFRCSVITCHIFLSLPQMLQEEM